MPANSLPAEQAVIDYNNPAAVEDYFTASFPNIQPTAKELFNGRLNAYEVALRRQQDEALQAKRQERRNMLLQPWTAQQMYNKAIETGRAIAAAEGFNFVLDEHNKKVFQMLCLYFVGDATFETYQQGGVPYSLKKGIWLQSQQRGSGKSTLLKCFMFNKRCCFGYTHTAQLANIYQRGGFDKLDFFIGTIPQPASAANFYQPEAGFMYDELFGEGKVNHMGTPIVVSEYIVNKLYDFADNKKGNMYKFHCTSNASGEDIERIAGINFRSRMPDMFNLIKLDGPDRRR